MAIEINDSELLAIIADVQREVDAVLDDVRKSQRTVTNLRKTAGDDEGSEPEASAGDDEGSAGGEGSPEASAGPGPEASAGGEGAPEGLGDEGSMGGDDMGGEMGGEDAGMAGGDLEAKLQAAYSSMDPEELMAHYKAAKAAVFQLMQGGDAGAGMGAGPAEGSPAMGPEGSAPGMGTPEGSPGPGMGAGPGPAAPAPGPGDQMMAMGKTQIPAHKENGGQMKAGAKMAKSETERALDALVKSQDEKIETLSKALELLLGQPQRKAVTGVDFLHKSELKPEAKPLTKSEVTTKLTQVARNPKLTKSDRDAINGYVAGSMDFSAIEHLIK